jgi:hypothetical protein
LSSLNPTKTGENLDAIMKDVGRSVSVLFQPWSVIWSSVDPCCQ